MSQGSRLKIVDLRREIQQEAREQVQNAILYCEQKDQKQNELLAHLREETQRIHSNFFELGKKVDEISYSGALRSDLNNWIRDAKSNFNQFEDKVIQFEEQFSQFRLELEELRRFRARFEMLLVDLDRCNASNVLRELANYRESLQISRNENQVSNGTPNPYSTPQPRIVRPENNGHFETKHQRKIPDPYEPPPSNQYQLDPQQRHQPGTLQNPILPNTPKRREPLPNLAKHEESLCFNQQHTMQQTETETAGPLTPLVKRTARVVRKFNKAFHSNRPRTLHDHNCFIAQFFDEMPIRPRLKLLEVLSELHPGNVGANSNFKAQGLVWGDVIHALQKVDWHWME